MTLTASETNRNIMIVAGESSGDLHGSNLIRAAAEEYPQLRFFGVGGERMRSAGCRIVFPSDELSVMGLVEVFAQLPKLIARFRQLKKILQGPEQPDLLVLIDFPDFNLRLAKVAKRVGVPVLYYISPKVWAWRSGRAKTIAERVDRMALIFPFEPQIYRSFGVNAEYVGNPLLDEFAANPPAGTLRQQLGISENEQVVGIFPGSRNSELKYIFATLLETARELQERKPDIRFLLPVAPSLSKQFFVEQLRDCNLPIEIVEENIYETASACDAILSVSGTVTLQITLVKIPLVILYKMAPLSFAIGKRLIKVAYAGLTNIIAGKEIAREFIQDAATPTALSNEVVRMLDDQAYRLKMQKDLTAVAEQMGAPGCSAKVARIVADMTAVVS